MRRRRSGKRIGGGDACPRRPRRTLWSGSRSRLSTLLSFYQACIHRSQMSFGRLREIDCPIRVLPVLTLCQPQAVASYGKRPAFRSASMRRWRDASSSHWLARSLNNALGTGWSQQPRGGDILLRILPFRLYVGAWETNGVRRSKSLYHDWNIPAVMIL